MISSQKADQWVCDEVRKSGMRLIGPINRSGPIKLLIPHQLRWDNEGHDTVDVAAPMAKALTAELLHSKSCNGEGR